MKYLEDELKKYAASDMYPFHMPGHKRKNIMMENAPNDGDAAIDEKGKVTVGETSAFSIDITEIDGFDNLHHAEGLIKEAQERAAALYGSKKCSYLVNGSTCGILAAIFATVPEGGHLLMARNSHKAAYHAAQLRHIKVTYLYPEITEEGLQGSISPQKIEAYLDQYPDIQAVFLTSPTYDGVVSDIHSIAELVHQKGKVLIVDEAHGAHLGFHPYFPKSAVTQGADVEIMSLHKMLPSYTQTALLHACSDRVDTKKIDQYLDMFETSSPSYVFMAAMDQCVRALTHHSGEWFDVFADRLEKFYDQTNEFKHLYVWRGKEKKAEQVYDFDPSKILIFSKEKEITGKKIYDILKEQYHLQLEMYAGNYCTALTTIMDTAEGFNRLKKALLEIDQKIESLQGDAAKLLQMKNGENAGRKWAKKENTLYIERTALFQLSEIEEKEKETIELQQASGTISAEYIYLYPPGIPVIVPGERINQTLIDQMQQYLVEGYLFQGMKDESNRTIEVIKEALDRKKEL